MPGAIMECPDISDFQDALKNLRKPEDIIVSTINDVIPTNSFHKDEENACKDLHAQLKEGHEKRDNLIKNCILVTTDRVKKLKEERELKTDDIQVNKLLKQEQTKLRMLQVELTVEELIRQRTLKVFNERCRKFLKL
ncbi:protein MIX23 [Aethina tumida]|uniref:protein MIX23 n=1 Tax=Aethina tumida TaxID=116153 RepID=UPI002147E00C|nr:protein MIX23 [Aethina tumida]